MNYKNTWFWLCLAAVLLGAIFFREHFTSKGQPGPNKVLPELKVSAVSSIQVRPKGQLEIRAVRTNNTWQLTEPLLYPAQAISIEELLGKLERLTPATYITPGELRNRPNADEEYGFKTPRASIIIQQGNYQVQVLVGTMTGPGDQLFMQVVGVEGVHVVDVDVLKSIPRNANDWRDTTLISLKGLSFDRLSVTNGAKAVELQHDPAARVWRMVTPPIQARADHTRIEEMLQNLQNTRVSQFVSDSPQTDLEALGLQPAGLIVALNQGTNTAAMLQFGKSPTNDPTQVYARRVGQNTIVTVPTNQLQLCYGSVNDFRDPHLIASTEEAQTIEVHHGEEVFTLQRQTNASWQVLPQNFRADSAAMKDFLSALSTMPIVEFAKDVVTPVDLPNYGLTIPSGKYILKSGPSNSTNGVLVELDFGTNQNDRVFVRRSDESSVYAVSLKDFQRLPSASFQLRERQISSFSENEIVSASIRQQGKVRQLLRKGAHEWSLAPGSQGFINELAIEETVRPLCHLAAVAWVAHGEQNRARFGFEENGHKVTLELKNGDKWTIEFGGASRLDGVYAAVKLDGDLWIFEFPSPLYRFVLSYLTIPANLL